MRALLIVNPRATATAQAGWQVAARALAPAAELEVVQTRYRGHATQLARAAAAAGLGLVVTLGGDGTANEAANGLLHARGAAPPPAGGHAAGNGAAPDGRQDLRRPPVTATEGCRPAGETAARPLPLAPPAAPDIPAAPPSPAGTGLARAARPPGQARPGAGPSFAGPPPVSSVPPGPALAALPGGHANVFTRALGLPPEPVAAARQVAAALTAGTARTVSVGLAGDRYFCVNAGLGIDAEVVRAVEGLRARRETVTAALYVRTTVRQLWAVTDRRAPALTLERAGKTPVDGLFCGIVSNTSAWTYLGRLALRPSPRAGFGTGLDLFALRKLGMLTAAGAVARMLAGTRGGRPSPGRHTLSVHDEPSFTLRARRPIAFQVDGEYVGEAECVTFTAIPHALRVIA